MATVVSHNDTMVICTTPANTGGNEVTIGFNLQSFIETLRPVFYYDPPTITSIFPLNGATRGEYELTITGTNFGPDYTRGMFTSIM
jgi:hypothetical protein